MTKKKWATPAQESWLTEKMSAFVKAQQTKTTSQFFTLVYEAWHKEFPPAEPANEDIDKADGNKATAQALIMKMEKAVSILLIVHHTFADTKL